MVYPGCPGKKAVIRMCVQVSSVCMMLSLSVLFVSLFVTVPAADDDNSDDEDLWRIRNWW